MCRQSAPAAEANIDQRLSHICLVLVRNIDRLRLHNLNRAAFAEVKRYQSLR